MNISRKRAIKTAVVAVVVADCIGIYAAQQHLSAPASGASSANPMAYAVPSGGEMFRGGDGEAFQAVPALAVADPVVRPASVPAASPVAAPVPASVSAPIAAPKASPVVEPQSPRLARTDGVIRAKVHALPTPAKALAAVEAQPRKAVAAVAPKAPAPKVQQETFSHAFADLGSAPEEDYRFGQGLDGASTALELAQFVPDRGPSAPIVDAGGLADAGAASTPNEPSAEALAEAAPAAPGGTTLTKR